MWVLFCWIMVAAAWTPDQLDTWVDSLGDAPEQRDVSQGYQFSSELFKDLAMAVRDKPGVVQAEKIGVSTRDRPIIAFHISDPTTPVTRKVLIFAGIHALEWVSTEVAVHFFHELVRTPPKGTRVTVIPLLNPDGRAKVERDLIAGENKYRRGNEKNIDLNRDFSVNRVPTSVWYPLMPKRYATSPSPLSQPESQALDTLAARERYHRAVSLHAFGGFFYYPWSGRVHRPPHWKEFVAMGRAMERAMGTKAYKTRQLSRWAFFFRAQGSEIDHLYGQYGTKPFLIEVTRSGLNPFKPRTFKQYFRWYNPPNVHTHRTRVTRSLWALTDYPTLESEVLWPPPEPLEP